MEDCKPQDIWSIGQWSSAYVIQTRICLLHVACEQSKELQQLAPYKWCIVYSDLLVPTHLEEELLSKALSRLSSLWLPEVKFHRLHHQSSANSANLGAHHHWVVRLISTSKYVGSSWWAPKVTHCGDVRWK